MGSPTRSQSVRWQHEPRTGDVDRRRRSYIDNILPQRPPGRNLVRDVSSRRHRVACRSTLLAARDRQEQKHIVNTSSTAACSSVGRRLSFRSICDSRRKWTLVKSTIKESAITEVNTAIAEPVKVDVESVSSITVNLRRHIAPSSAAVDRRRACLSYL